jgi:hypothetical protein
MTPIEKANELVTKFMPLVTTWDCYWDAKLPDDEIIKDAKKCALIAVEEIIKVCPLTEYDNIGSQYSPEEIGLENFTQFWILVREEIEKL